MESVQKFSSCIAKWAVVDVWAVVTFAMATAGWGGANADVRFFLSPNGYGEATRLTDPTWEYPQPDIGQQGEIHLWAQTSALITGISLDLLSDSTAIAFQSLEIPNYPTGGGTRWLFMPDPAIEPTELRHIEMAALIGLGSTGMNPETAASDSGYDANLDAFHLAKIGYRIEGAGGATLNLRVGRNIIGLVTDEAYSLFLGPGDQPVENRAGAVDSQPDGRVLLGIVLTPHAPEPSTLLLLVSSFFLLPRGRRR